NGRLTALDRLARLGRQVFRRDAALGLACTAPLIGATNVWTAGPDVHRRHVADLLLSNRTLAIAYTELQHGNDIVRGDLSARPVAAMPHVRAILARALVDLIVSDCLATTVARALHVHPEAAGVYAAAAKYFVPARVAATMNELATVLGAQFYHRQGEYGIF